MTSITSKYYRLPDSTYVTTSLKFVPPEDWVEVPSEEAKAWFKIDYERLRAEMRAKLDYKQLRKMEYPPLTDYIDGVVKGDDAQVQNYIAQCRAVKAKYPKPESK